MLWLKIYVSVQTFRGMEKKHMNLDKCNFATQHPLSSSLSMKPPPEMRYFSLRSLLRYDFPPISSCSINGNKRHVFVCIF